MFRTIIRAALIGAFAAVAISGSAYAASKNFHNPKYGSNRLDYCLTWGTDCGQAAADAFCVNKGYTNATAFTEAQDIGASHPTRLIGNGAVCDQAMCDGFSSITCSSPGATTFNHPTYNGNQLDYCVTWGTDCGQAAADKYCQSKGMTHATNFAENNDIGATSPTRLIGNGAVCDQAMCDGFTFIDCQ